MAAIVLSTVMDAIAARIVAVGVTKRAYGWPNTAAMPISAIVSYPEDDIEFDVTFGRGSDRAVFPVFIICGGVHDRSSRDVVSGYITGATGIKDALDGTLGGVVQTARVTGCQVDTITLSGVEYLAAKLLLEVYT
jgi:hypothetical protein